LYVVLWGFIEVGSISLYRAALKDEKPTKAHFMDGIKSYFTKVLSGKLLIHLIILILSPILVLLFFIYFVVIGIPSAGWGLVFLSTTIGVLFATWTIAIVSDDYGAIEAIKKSFEFGKSNFKIMFITILSMTMISSYAMMLFGPLGFLLAGWFIGGVVSTYFRIIIYMTYLDHSKTVKG